jgi:hypothetical protein
VLAARLLVHHECSVAVIVVSRQRNRDRCPSDSVRFPLAYAEFNVAERQSNR